MVAYWFPIALALVLWRLTGWGKTALWNDQLASVSRLARIGRRTLPLHAPLLGAAIGAIPSAPWPAGIAFPWTAIAGAAVGVGCSWVVGAVRHYLARAATPPGDAT